MRAQREYAVSGQPLRETHWRDDRQAEETLRYLNGKVLVSEAA